ncbi:MAG: ribosome biogenesis GTPase Der [Bdellovibrionaceae bacterium]|nr:ribosome biogenesis GTPase Der [Pseudobdellovibrionaceae bacterium]
MEKNKIMTTMAVVGRPNVGKSTLFNLLSETRKAVVKDEPGVTRDILFENAELWGKHYEIIDTGGLTDADDTISIKIKEHVVEFLKTVDFLLVVMDGRMGLVPEDRDIIRIAKESGKPFIIAVNKIDKVSELDTLTAEFYQFGTDVVGCSFEQRLGLDPLLQWIYDRVEQAPPQYEDAFVLSIVGKPNVGKSSLCNRLLGQNRLLVSDIAGTTTDAVDVPFTYNDKNYVLIDTAGLRRTSRRFDDVEIISAFKTERSIRNSELVLLVIDGTLGPTDQDAKILEMIQEEHKGVVLVVNKSDIGEDEMDAYRKTVREQVARQFHFYTDIPIVFISALTGRGLGDLFKTIEDVRSKLYFRISTRELNDFFIEVIRQAPSPVYGTKDVKFYYLTQTQQFPPSFIAFANHPDGVDNSYRRFLAKKIKERWALEGIPVRIFVMKSRGR